MRRPSAALVVATAALVMSTIGTSVAATHFVISSPKQIKPGTITLNALTKAARRPCAGNAARVGRQARQVRPEPSARPGRPGLSATKLWAQIGADGSVNASSGGVTARVGVSPGTYAVNFGQDITRCAAMATQGAIPAYAAAGRRGWPRRRPAPARLQRGDGPRAGVPLDDHGARDDDERSGDGRARPDDVLRRGLLLTEACA